MMRLAWPPRSFTGQTLATTIAALFAAQILTMLFFGAFVLIPQAKRVAGLVAQSVAAVSDAADLSGPPARAAIIKRLDASPFIDVWPGDTAPPPTGPRPRMLERFFLQALVDALADHSTELSWRTDWRRRLWIQVRIGPDMYWISAQSPVMLQPFTAILLSATASFVLALIAVVAMQRRVTRPLENLTDAVKGFSLNATPTPVPEHGASELVALSRGFNAMTARLAEAEKERTLLLAGVSHDLRTPLAKLRLAVEMLAPGDAPLARAANNHVAEIDRVLGQFLMFARGFESEREVAFDIDALVSEIAAMRLVEGFTFEIIGDRIGVITGRPESLRRALVNLTENATKYGAPDFSIGAERRGDLVDLIVRDRGAGAPEGQLSSLRRPFARGGSHPEKQPGTGLGLAIVERVAVQHGGTLHLANLTPKGFEARLSIRVVR